MKFFKAFLLLSSILVGDITTYISSIDNSLYVKNINDVQIGSSGILIREYDESHSTIYKRVVVISKSDKGMKLKISPFTYTKKNLLPTPQISAKVGDKVILNYMHNRVLPITKNSDSYTKIIRANPNLEFIHPDIFSSYLYIQGENKPSQDNFKYICTANSIGLVLFEFKNMNYYVDCFSFKVMKKENTSYSETLKQLPFYSRINKTSKSLVSFSTIKNFDNYYKNLIK